MTIAQDRWATSGHIRATNDRIAADNSRHHQLAICPAQSAYSHTDRRSPRPLGAL